MRGARHRESLGCQAGGVSSLRGTAATDSLYLRGATIADAVDVSGAGKRRGATSRAAAPPVRPRERLLRPLRLRRARDTPTSPCDRFRRTRLDPSHGSGDRPAGAARCMRGWEADPLPSPLPAFRSGLAGGDRGDAPEPLVLHPREDEGIGIVLVRNPAKTSSPGTMPAAPPGGVRRLFGQSQDRLTGESTDTNPDAPQSFCGSLREGDGGCGGGARRRAPRLFHGAGCARVGACARGASATPWQWRQADR